MTYLWYCSSSSVSMVICLQCAYWPFCSLGSAKETDNSASYRSGSESGWDHTGFRVQVTNVELEFWWWRGSSCLDIVCLFSFDVQGGERGEKVEMNIFYIRFPRNPRFSWASAWGKLNFTCCNFFAGWLHQWNCSISLEVPHHWHYDDV